MPRFAANLSTLYPEFELLDRIGAAARDGFAAVDPRVPLIVLTGFPDTDMATSFLRQGVVDYLVKPVEGERLRAAVARAMDQRELARL